MPGGRGDWGPSWRLTTIVSLNQKGNIRNVSFPNVNLNKEVNGDKVKLPEIKFWE